MDAESEQALGTEQLVGNNAILRGAYRYLLWRTWNSALPNVLWVLLNPSTADAHVADPTLRRCMAFSRGWGYGGLEIANLFAYRTAYPHELRAALDPVGRENDRFLSAAVMRAPLIVAAWGAHGTHRARDRFVLALLARHATPQCLGTTKNGSPRHPLYVAGATLLQPYAQMAS